MALKGMETAPNPQ